MNLHKHSQSDNTGANVSGFFFLFVGTIFQIRSGSALWMAREKLRKKHSTSFVNLGVSRCDWVSLLSSVRYLSGSSLDPCVPPTVSESRFVRAIMIAGAHTAHKRVPCLSEAFLYRIFYPIAHVGFLSADSRRDKRNIVYQCFV